MKLRIRKPSAETVGEIAAKIVFILFLLFFGVGAAFTLYSRLIIHATQAL
jgi:hypothetical protein